MISHCSFYGDDLPDFKYKKRYKSPLCQLGIFLGLILFTLFNSQQTLAQPTGFVEETIGEGWYLAVGMTFSEDGEQMYVWEKTGKVWIVENGEKLPEPLIDISEEVGEWGDHGLLGFALDPDFKHNGYFYLLYVVDRHYLFNYGKSSYNSHANEYIDATIGRVTRYKANPDGTTDLNSRQVLLGESISTGLPILYVSHGIGSLVFGEDGSLLVSVGDGATASDKDTGWQPGQATDNFVARALQEGILAEVNNVGAFRAQQINSLNGKILRIDPETGDGLPSNPFYNKADPRAAESRVWALGLRNPFRFSIRPGTGSPNHPGTLFIGDVGWQDWEEINVATEGGLNFGWPLYEGFEEQKWYSNAEILTPDIPNPLYGSGDCDRKTLYFKELITQPKSEQIPFFGNLCDESITIANDAPTFVHARPTIDWANAAETDPEPPISITRTGAFNGEEATVIHVGDPNSPVTGSPFYGSSSTGGIWYTSSRMPAEFQNAYFFGDYGAKWIKVLRFDDDNHPIAIDNFIDGGATVTAFAANPASGELYYINYGPFGPQIKKLTYYDGNTPPKAIAEADVLHGVSPLTIQFTGSGSTDVENHALTYLWDFGDGSDEVAEPNPSYTFLGEGREVFKVSLKVTDEEGLSSTARLTITLNDTPPIVKIISPTAGIKYPMNKLSTYDLRAEVTDQEDSDDQLTYEWQVVLHHNTHTHPEPIDYNHETSATIAAIGCDGDFYFYRFSLKVTDTSGLSASDHVDIYPDCSGEIIEAITIASPAFDSKFALGEPIELAVDFVDKTRNWAKVEYLNATSPIAETSTAPFDYIWNGATAGFYNIVAKATDSSGHSILSDPVFIKVGDGGVTQLPDCLPGVVHYLGLDETEGETYSDHASTFNATCIKCPEPIEDGVFLGAKRFNSIGTGLDLQNTSNFNWSKSSDFSMGMWIRTTANPTGEIVILGRNAAAEDNGLHWWVGLNSRSQAIFSLKDMAHSGVEIGGSKGKRLNDGNWHHIVAVRDAAAKLNKLFVDGKLVESQYVEYQHNFFDDTPVNIGYLDRFENSYYEGDLDEVKIYNRAVAPEEIFVKYNNGNGAYCGLKPLHINDGLTITSTFKASPNPTNGERINIFASLFTPGEQVSLLLVDITGKTILEQTFTISNEGIIQETITPATRLARGLYNLLLFSKDAKLNLKVMVAY